MDALSWLRPALLWGLLGLSVPLLVHLLARRKRRALPFSTLRFLEKANARARTFLKVRNLLLLLTRLALVACLVALAAGPGCRRGAASGGMHRAVVLDTSLSMEARHNGQSALERAKSLLAAQFSASVEADRYALFVTAREGRDALPPFLDAASARERLAALAASPADGGLIPALEHAESRLTAQGGGEIVVLTDRQRHAWRGLSTLGKREVPVRVLDVGAPAPVNVWIDTVERGEGALRVTAAASGGAKAKAIHLELDDGRKLTSFPEEGGALFRPREEGGGLRRYTARVEPGGDLAADDALAFVASAGGPLRVLFVNGDPRGFEILDELLFVRRAFAAGGSLARRFETREIRQADLTAERVAEADVVVLANPAPLSPASAAFLEKRVRAGMGLVVTAGSGWTPDRAGDALDTLLAAPLRDRMLLREGDPARRPFEEIDPASLSGFLGPAAQGGDAPLSDARVRAYWLCDVDAKSGARVRAKLANQAPLLVERPLGEGRLMLFTTTLDRDWSDLCLRPSFLPFLDRLLTLAGGRGGAELAPFAILGARLASPFDEPVAVRLPDGSERPWLPGGEAFACERPGVHAVLSQGREIGGFTVRPDPDESNLDRLPDAELLASADGASPFVLQGGGEAVSGRVDRSSAAAAGLLACVVLEALLSWRRRRAAATETLGREGDA